MASTTGHAPTAEQQAAWQAAFHSVAVGAIADVLASQQPRREAERQQPQTAA